MKNEPAFPCSTWEDKDGVQIGTPVTGLSIRDWFAGMALQGLLASCSTKDAYAALTEQMNNATSCDNCLSVDAEG